MPTRTIDAHGPDPVDLYVGARVRTARREKGVSQESLAEALGLTFQQVQKYERGVNRVSASKLHAIAAALGAPIGYFFEGIDSGAGITHAARASIGLAHAPLGLELAEILPKLSTRQRRALLTIARDLAGEDTGDVGEGGEPLPLGLPAARYDHPRKGAH